MGSALKKFMRDINHQGVIDLDEDENLGTLIVLEKCGGIAKDAPSDLKFKFPSMTQQRRKTALDAMNKAKAKMKEVKNGQNR